MNQLMTTYLKMLKTTAPNSKSLIRLKSPTASNNNKMILITNQFKKKRRLLLRLKLFKVCKRN